MFEIKTFSFKDPKEQKILFDCLEVSFKMDYDYFVWKHVNEEFSREKRITFCVYNNDNCAATLQIIINSIHIGSNQHSFALIVDGATSPDYRGKGLYNKLLEHVINYLKKNEIDFMLAFGNNISRIPLEKYFEFQTFSPMYAAFRKIESNNLLHLPVVIARKWSFKISEKFKNKKFRIESIGLNVFLEFFEKSRENYAVSFDRLECDFNWRLQKPDADYTIYGVFDENKTIIGATIINSIHTDRTIVIDDFVYLNEKIKSAVLKEILFLAKSLAYSKKYKSIKYNSNVCVEEMNLFQSNGFTISTSAKDVLIRTINKDFKWDLNLSNKMHYTRIDKFE
jgi:hypothetical protein